MRRASLFAALILVLAVAFPLVAHATEPDPVYLPFEWFDTTDPAAAPHHSDPALTSDTPILVGGGWVAGSRGLAQCAPTVNDFFFTIRKVSASGDIGDVVAAIPQSQSRRWWGPTLPATPDEFGDLSHFRDTIGAKPFYRSWDGPAGTLPAGTYFFAGGFTQKRPANDLFWYFDGQRSPEILPPGTVTWYFYFDVTD